MITADYFQTIGGSSWPGAFGQGDTATRRRSPSSVSSPPTDTSMGAIPSGCAFCYRMGSFDSFTEFTVVGIAGDTREMGMTKRSNLLSTFRSIRSTDQSASPCAPHRRHGAHRHAHRRAVDPTQPLYGAQPLQSSSTRRSARVVSRSSFCPCSRPSAGAGGPGFCGIVVLRRPTNAGARRPLAMARRRHRSPRLGAGARSSAWLFFGAVLAAVLGKYLLRSSGLSPWDPQAVGLIAALMVLAALAAGWVPARRAAALPLANALRTE